MDRELAERLAATAPPFSGVCLYPDDSLKITDLVKVLGAVCDCIKEEFGDIGIRSLDDWLIHDGWLSSSKRSSWEEIENAIQSEESIYNYRHEDDFVYRAFYPEDFSFLLRFDVFDEDDEDEEYPGIWGTFDICGPNDWVQVLHQRLTLIASTEFVVESAKHFFDRLVSGAIPPYIPDDNSDPPGRPPPMPEPPQKQKSNIQELIISLTETLSCQDIQTMLSDLNRLEQQDADLSFDQREYIGGLAPHIVWNLMASGRLEELIAIAGMSLFPRRNFYEGLDRKASAMETELLLRLVAKAGFPDESSYKGGVYRELVTRPAPLIATFLKQFILNPDEKISFNGPSFSDHEKTFSTFQFVRLAPEGQSIARAVEILAKRMDPETIEFLAGLIENPPWPPDSAPYVQLIESVMKRPGDRIQDSLMTALRKFPKQYYVRRLIMTALFYYRPNMAVRRLLMDLGKMPEDERVEHIAYLDHFLGQGASPGGVELDQFNVLKRLEQLDANSWSWASRAYLKKVMDVHFEGLGVIEGHGLLDDLALLSVRYFQTFRIDHMGCGIILPIMLGAGWLLILLLDYLLGTPETALGFMDNIMLFIWVIIVGATATTHFSGHETIRQQFVMSILFWLATLGFPLSLLIVHLV